MGIYDREYYRREGPSYLGSITQRGRVCKWLVGINVLLFIAQLVTQASPDPQFPRFIVDEDGVRVVKPVHRFSVTDALKMDAEGVLHGEIWRLLTYAFLHDPDHILHIVFNMLVLWWFGTEIESIYGSREFLAYYLTAAVIGGITFELTWRAGLSGPYALGASGAVIAVLVLFALHYPRHIVYLIVLPVPVWAVVVIQVVNDFSGLLFGTNLYELMLGRTGRIAVTVHLAGAAFALLYYKSGIRLMNFVPSLRGLRRLRRNPRLRVYREEPRPPVAANDSIPTSDEQLEAKLDAVLEKVARYGQSSLTESERSLLLRASEVYRRRRT
jgi:membrane associated rhomboid family serine protease